MLVMVVAFRGDEKMVLFALFSNAFATLTFKQPPNKTTTIVYSRYFSLQNFHNFTLLAQRSFPSHSSASKQTVMLFVTYINSVKFWHKTMAKRQSQFRIRLPDYSSSRTMFYFPIFYTCFYECSKNNEVVSLFECK